MVRDLDESVRDLIASIFRLAFCDYVGLAYGHDEPYDDKYTRITPEFQPDAAKFLTSHWAAHLGDLAGLTAKIVWKQAQRDLLRRPVTLPRPKKVPPMQLVVSAEAEECLLRPDDEIAAVTRFENARGRSKTPSAGGVKRLTPSPLRLRRRRVHRPRLMNRIARSPAPGACRRPPQLEQGSPGSERAFRLQAWR